MVTAILAFFGSSPAFAGTVTKAAVDQCYVDQRNALVLYARRIKAAEEAAKRVIERNKVSPPSIPPGKATSLKSDPTSLPPTIVEQINSSVQKRADRLHQVWIDSIALRLEFNLKKAYSEEDANSLSKQKAFYQLQLDAQGVAVMPMISDCSLLLNRHLGHEIKE